MSRDTLGRVIVVCLGGFIVYALYMLLSEPTFPWALMTAIVVIFAAVLFLLRNILFGDVRREKSSVSRSRTDVVLHGSLMLIGSVLGLAAGLLYNVLSHRAIRWETFAGMLLPMSLFVVILWMYRHQRRSRERP